MVVLLKTASVRVSFIQIMQIRVQNKGKSVRKSRYDGDVSNTNEDDEPLRDGVRLDLAVQELAMAGYVFLDSLRVSRIFVNL